MADDADREDALFELVADLSYGEPADFETAAKNAMPDVTTRELVMTLVLQKCASIVGEIETAGAILEAIGYEVDHNRREIARLVYPDWPELKALLKDKALMAERVDRLRKRKQDLN
jgi:hypothetical protein